jgi:hypothetical protein
VDHAEAARKLLYLATVDITRKWTAPIATDLGKKLEQMSIFDQDRLPLPLSRSLLHSLLLVCHLHIHVLSIDHKWRYKREN